MATGDAYRGEVAIGQSGLGRPAEREVERGLPVVPGHVPALGMEAMAGERAVGKFLPHTALKGASVVVERALLDVVPGDAVVVRGLFTELDAVAAKRLGEANT